MCAVSTLLTATAISGCRGDKGRPAGAATDGSTERQTADRPKAHREADPGVKGLAGSGEERGETEAQPQERTPEEAQRERRAEEAERGYEFTEDFFTYRVLKWEQMLGSLAGKRDLRYLEIGVFEGRCMLWMLEKILTHPTARATAIDIFSGTLKKRYLANIEKAGVAAKVTTIVGRSAVELRRLPRDSFDIIYVDGGHTARDVLADAVLSFDLLREGGILIFDDYRWEEGKWPDDMRPQVAIDAFVTAYRNYLEVLDHTYVVFVKKVPDRCRYSPEGERVRVPGEDYCTQIGQYQYYWQRGVLVEAATGRPVEVSAQEKRLIWRIGRSIPFGGWKPRLSEEDRKTPVLQRLLERLDLEI